MSDRDKTVKGIEVRHGFTGYPVRSACGGTRFHHPRFAEIRMCLRPIQTLVNRDSIASFASHVGADVQLAAQRCHEVSSRFATSWG